MDSTLKTLIDRFRSKPEWQHADAAVRASAVLRLPSSEQELLAAIAREDADGRVRRAAIKKLADGTLLASIVASDPEASVREEAEARLVQQAVHETAAEAAVAFVAGLREAKSLGQVARAAVLASTREAAVRALRDARTLAAIARDTEDAATRMLALSRIDDTPTLLALALKSESKGLALAAVERIQDADALRAIADKARAGAAQRRARAKLEGHAEAAQTAPPASPAPGFDDDAERRAYEEARAAHEREAAARAEALAARRAIAEAIEAAEGEAIPEALERARGERAALTPVQGAEIEALERRIEASLVDGEARHAAHQQGLARRGELLALVEQAEAIVEADPGPAPEAFAAVEARWNEATRAAELPDLRARFEAVRAKLATRRDAARHEQARQAQDLATRLLQLVERADVLLAQGAAAALRDADHVLREIREALEHPGQLPTRRERESLLARLEAARKRLYPLVQQLREDAEWKRWANVSVQEELCARAEALLNEPDAEKAARVLRELDLRWKQAKEAPKDQAEALWTRFKAAHDQVRARCDAALAQQAEEQAGNLAKKEALCQQAEALQESSDWLKTAEELRRLQAEWKAIGPLPRQVSQRVWERFRKPCDRFFTRWQEHRGQRSHEWAENLAKKEALCAQAEALQESSDWEGTAAELKRLQAEWRTIGAVKKSRSEAVWQRFRAACDCFFDRYKHRDEHERERARVARTTLCAELEALAPAAGGAEAPPDLAARVATAQTAWRQAGGLPHDELSALDARFAAARDRLIEVFPAAFAGSELDPDATRRKAERLLARVEELARELAPGGGAPAARTAEELAARLRDALATNTIGGRAAVEARWQAADAEIESAQLAWKRLGPLPAAEARSLSERLEQACRQLTAARPPRERSQGERQRPAAPRQRVERGSRAAR